MLTPVVYDPPRRIELRGHNRYWTMVLRTGALLGLAIGLSLLFDRTGWWDRWPALKFVAFFSLFGAGILAWDAVKRGRRPTYPKAKIVFTAEGVATYHRADAAVRHYPTERLGRLSILQTGNYYRFHFYNDTEPAFEFSLMPIPDRPRVDLIADLQELLRLPERRTYQPRSYQELHVLTRPSAKAAPAPGTLHPGQPTPTVPVTFDLASRNDYRAHYFRRIITGSKVTVVASRRNRITGKQKFEFWPDDGIIKVIPTLLMGKAYSMRAITRFDQVVSLNDHGSDPFAEGELWFETKQGHRVTLLTLSVSLLTSGEMIYADLTDDLRYLVTALNKQLE